MAVTSIPSPFYNFSEYKKYRDMMRKSRELEYDEFGLVKNSGFRKRPKSAKQRELMTSLGFGYKTPDDVDLDKYMKFLRQANGGVREEFDGKYKSIQTLGEYVQYAFEHSSAKRDSVECQGHIQKLEYSYQYMLLKAHFTNRGAVVVYFYVPKAVYETLESLAGSPATRLDARKVPRHLVGIYFWDIIRIRGSLNGSKYVFTYEEENQSGGYTTLAKETSVSGSRDMRDPIERLKDEAAADEALGNRKEAQAIRDFIKQVEENRDTGDGGEDKMLSDISMKDTQSERIPARVSRRLAPEEQSRFDAMKDKYRGAPIAFLHHMGDGRTPQDAAIMAMFMGQLRSLPPGLLGGDLKARYDDLMKLKEGEDRIAPYLRTEEFLVEKGIWPRY